MIKKKKRKPCLLFINRFNSWKDPARLYFNTHNFDKKKEEKRIQKY